MLKWIPVSSGEWPEPGEHILASRIEWKDWTECYFSKDGDRYVVAKFEGGCIWQCDFADLHYWARINTPPKKLKKTRRSS